MPRSRRLTDINLNTVPFQGAVFTPIDYTPIAPDYNIMQQSFAKQEEREIRENQQRSIYNKAINDARRKLSQDEETLQWFDNKVNKQLNKIDEAAKVGDIQEAYNIGLNAVDEVLDKEYFARSDRYAQYSAFMEEQRKRIGNGLSQAKFEWFKAQHPYADDFIKDENGNVIGNKEWNKYEMPQNDLNIPQLTLTSFKLLTPEKNSYASSHNYDKDNKEKYSDITQVNKNNYERITIDRIYNNINAIIGSDPNNWRAMREDFQVHLYELEKLEDKKNKLLEERDSFDIGSDEYNSVNDKYNLANKQYEDQLAYFKGENNQILSNTEEGWKLYTSRIISDNMFAQGLAYDWRDTTNSTIIEKPTTQTTPTDPAQNGLGNDEDKKESSEGNKTKINNNSGIATSAINQTVQSVTEMFGDNNIQVPFVTK